MTGSERDDFDDKVIEEMVKMFEQMGVPIDTQKLKSMIDQVRSQFEEMGIDPDRMAMSEVKFGINSNPEEFKKQMESMMSGPQGLGDFLKKMGVDIHIKPAETEVQVNVDESDQSINDNSIPEDDIHIQDGTMHITIDISRYDDIDPDNLELSLTGGGEVLQLLKTTQIRPFKTFVLPHASKDQPQWELNNGILDITFDLR